MKRFFIALLLVFPFIGNSQTPNETPGSLPSIIPASPEVSSIVKAGYTSTGLFTGSANINIPLYELVVGSLKIPIALGYSTNGTKLNEIPSRVGLNWSLVAGGMISRTIHDEEDGGQSTIQLPPPANINDYNQALLNYVNQATLEHYDTEADEYSFSVNGLSGKFFFDANGIIRLADHSNVKITKSGDVFTLIADNGTKYEFGQGGKVEKTKDVKTAGSPRAHKIKTTAWFLTKITSSEGDEISFTYQPIATRTNMGPYQSVILRRYQPYLPDFPPAHLCEYVCNGQWSSYGFTKIDYDTYVLSKISASNGQQVYFVYQDRPDASGDNRLLNVNVYTNNSNPSSVAIKKYKLEYEDRTIGNDLNQRFFLKKVIQQTNEVVPRTLTHEFQYNDPTSLRSQESLRQDYYGYSKGIGNEPSNFFPRPNDYNSYENGPEGADRSPDFEATKAGTLKKVIYPTGGFEEFTYEPNTIVQNQSEETYTSSYEMNVNGGGYNYDPDICAMTTVTHPFSLAHPQLKISHVTNWNPSGPPPGSPLACNPDGIHFLCYFEIWDMITNTRIFESRHKAYQGNDYVIQLEPGVLYEARLKVKGKSTNSYINFQFNPVIQTTTINVPVCGLRVKKIDAYDPLADKTYKKYYKYSSMEFPNRSSGVGVIKPVFEATYQGGGICSPPTNTGTEYGGDYIAQCHPERLLQVSASSISDAYSFNGSPVGYRHVIETNDEEMNNGGIEHNFYAVFNPHQPLPVLNHSIIGSANHSAGPDLNGNELNTKVFKKNGNSFTILKHTQNNFQFDSRIGSSRPNYVSRKRWGASGFGTFFDKLKGFDINSYLYLSRWWYLSSSTVTEYDENGLNPIVKTSTNTYGDTRHLQPTQVVTTNSGNETISQTMKYPHDYSVSPYTDMVANNIIGTMIETVTSNASDQVSAVKNEYTGWAAGANTFYKPQTVKVSSGNNALENRLRYYGYDIEANPVELSKEGGHRLSYLWNYQKSFPVAEVKNASVSEIAYTSFEGDDNGSWNVTGTKIDGGVTGKKYLSGSLSLSLINTSKPYVVTLWTQSTATVNSSTGTLVTSKNGWNLYKWNISTGTGSLSVVGTMLDEVRLHPNEAEMTTYTYYPFIGLSSTCNANNVVNYYTYDGFNRLVLIRDADNNIIKKVCYTYANQTEECPISGGVICTNTDPNWQNTGNTRCQISPQTGVFTGHQENEQLDNNTCSPTYGQLNWVDAGVNLEMCSVPPMVTITSLNSVGLSGYVAVYTLRSNGQTFTFNIPAGTTQQTLGSIPAGSYDLTISKPTGGILQVLLFGSGCSYVTGTSANFTRINVSTANCNSLIIDYDF